MRLTMPEKTEHLMNHARAKTILFSFLRNQVQQSGADAFIAVQDVWHAKYTEEGMKHREEAEKIHFQGFEELVYRGWAERYEAVMVVAQTPEIAFTINRRYERADRQIRWVGEPQYSAVMPQAEFRGRLKMFGDSQPENLR